MVRLATARALGHPPDPLAAAPGLLELSSKLDMVLERLSWAPGDWSSSSSSPSGTWASSTPSPLRAEAAEFWPAEPYFDELLGSSTEVSVPAQKFVDVPQFEYSGIQAKEPLPKLAQWSSTAGTLPCQEAPGDVHDHEAHDVAPGVPPSGLEAREADRAALRPDPEVQDDAPGARSLEPEARDAARGALRPDTEAQDVIPGARSPEPEIRDAARDDLCIAPEPREAARDALCPAPPGPLAESPAHEEPENAQAEENAVSEVGIGTLLPYSEPVDNEVCSRCSCAIAPDDCLEDGPLGTLPSTFYGPDPMCRLCFEKEFPDVQSEVDTTQLDSQIRVALRLRRLLDEAGLCSANLKLWLDRSFELKRKREWLKESSVLAVSLKLQELCTEGLSRLEAA